MSSSPDDVDERAAGDGDDDDPMRGGGVRRRGKDGEASESLGLSRLRPRCAREDVAHQDLVSYPRRCNCHTSRERRRVCRRSAR